MNVNCSIPSSLMAGRVKKLEKLKIHHSNVEIDIGFVLKTPSCCLTLLRMGWIELQHATSG